MSGKRILVVEDDDAIRQAIEELLELEGYEVRCARDGDEALLALRGAAELPHLILLDLMMPVKDGFAFREEQRADPELAHIPVLVLSAAADADKKAQSIGASGYIRKPPQLDDLLRRVERACL